MIHKQCKAHLIATDKVTDVVKINKGAVAGSLLLRKYYGSANTKMGDEYQHLYITSDKEIEEGDWYYDTTLEVIIKANSNSDHNIYTQSCRKIIATTDKLEYKFKSVNHSTFEPSISQQDIETIVKLYNDGENWEDVKVEYQCNSHSMIIEGNPRLAKHNKSYSPKLSPEGNVVLSFNLDGVDKPKMYSREEVESLLFNLAEHYAMTSTKGEIEDFNEWIKENLK
jgi:hypothetical protein